MSLGLPNIRYLGADLNSDCIKIACNNYSDKVNLDFLVSDGVSFVNSNLKPSSLYLYLATLECFAYDELCIVFEMISKLPTSFICLSEPVNIDLERQISSVPRGRCLYSHNYLHLARYFDFEVIHFEAIPLNSSDKFYQTINLIIKSTVSA